MVETPGEGRDHTALSRRGLLRAVGLASAAGAAAAFAPAAVARSATGETRVYRGRFSVGAPDWFYLPVEVPSGIRELTVTYSYDRPTPPPGVPGNALDIGIFSPAGHELGNSAGFRGWSGGYRDTFTISASSATPGYLPGRIGAGTWHVILGPYTVAPQGLEWTVEVMLTSGPVGAAFVPRPAPRQARGRGHAWYRGDLHLHTVHSDGARTPEELIAGAVAAKLDFVVSTEHNTSSASGIWGAVLEAAGTDRLLVVDGEEITTRNGHFVAAGLQPGQWIDWRYRAVDNALPTYLRQIHRVGGVAIAAHPYCPFVGCAWSFDYARMDAIEVWNGPWTLDDEYAVRLWSEQLTAARWLPAVGNSDAHREPQVIGLPQTVVRADTLSRDAVLAGVAAGRLYLAESAAVSTRLTAAAGWRRAGMGERLRGTPGEQVVVTASVLGAPACRMRLLTEAGVVAEGPVPAHGVGRLDYPTRYGAARYVRLEVRRPVPTATTPDTMVVLSNPVFLGGAEHQPSSTDLA